MLHWNLQHDGCTYDGILMSSIIHNASSCDKINFLIESSVDMLQLFNNLLSKISSSRFPGLQNYNHNTQRNYVGSIHNFFGDYDNTNNGYFEDTGEERKRKAVLLCDSDSPFHYSNYDVDTSTVIESDPSSKERCNADGVKFSDMLRLHNMKKNLFSYLGVDNDLPNEIEIANPKNTVTV